MHYVTSWRSASDCVKELVLSDQLAILIKFKLAPSACPWNRKLITTNQCQQTELKVCIFTKTTAACRWCSIKKLVENEIYNCITLQVTSENTLSWWDGRRWEKVSFLASFHPLEAQLLPLSWRHSDGGSLCCIQHFRDGLHQILRIICEHFTRLLVRFWVWNKQTIGF